MCLLRDDGRRVSRQKYLVLCNLKEIFQKFKEVFPDTKIGFSMFIASLRPKECVLAGASGTHSVCVCTIHQNMKLMIQGTKLGSLTSEWNSPITGCQECIARIACNPTTSACLLGSCQACVSLADFKEELVQIPRLASHLLIT